MRLFKMGDGWNLLYIVSALPGSAWLLGMLLGAVVGISWGGTSFEILFLLLIPFYLALLAGAVVLHFRDRDADPRRRPPLGVLWPAWVIAFVIVWGGVSTGLSRIGATAPATQHDLVAAQCTISLRDDSSPLGSDYHVIVYDRTCPSEPRYTVNVSILSTMRPEGPGNVFIAEADDGSAEVTRRLKVFAFPPQPGRNLEIVYDRRAHVLMHAPEWNAMKITVAMDTLDSR
jgi:hypothetical protein